MKFGQLIKHNVRNIFAEKSYKKCGGEKLFSDSSIYKILLLFKVLLRSATSRDHLQE